MKNKLVSDQRREKRSRLMRGNRQEGNESRHVTRSSDHKKSDVVPNPIRQVYK